MAGWTDRTHLELSLRAPVTRARASAVLKLSNRAQFASGCLPRHIHAIRRSRIRGERVDNEAALPHRRRRVLHNRAVPVHARTHAAHTVVFGRSRPEFVRLTVGTLFVFAQAHGHNPSFHNTGHEGGGLARWVQWRVPTHLGGRREPSRGAVHARCLVRQTLCLPRCARHALACTRSRRDVACGALGTLGRLLYVQTRTRARTNTHTHTHTHTQTHTRTHARTP